MVRQDHQGKQQGSRSSQPFHFGKHQFRFRLTGSSAKFLVLRNRKSVLKVRITQPMSHRLPVPQTGLDLADEPLTVSYCSNAPQTPMLPKPQYFNNSFEVKDITGEISER